MLAMSYAAAEIIEPMVPPIWKPPWHPHIAADRLRAWTCQIGDVVLESSERTMQALEAHLMAADEEMVTRMNVWLSGKWCDREALIELLWRLEVGERCVAAGLWLHDIAHAGGEFVA